MKLTGFLFGIAFGFLIALAQFTDYDVIHQGLLMKHAYIYLVMASSVVVSMLLLMLLTKLKWRTLLGGPLKLTKLPVRKHHIWGGALFGIGWAITGTCPTVSAAMVGTGKLLGLSVMAGLFVGVLVKDAWSKH
ncbi:DUF6691 family protein [Cohnella yongneupensis]|uniref:DUF6691 family protein n=1 Tax=Cohnella yongneupensis TaxID=425006 RepID=A0ABW0R0B4_9BACL